MLCLYLLYQGRVSRCSVDLDWTIVPARMQYQQLLSTPASEHGHEQTCLPFSCACLMHNQHKAMLAACPGRDEILHDCVLARKLPVSSSKAFE